MLAEKDRAKLDSIVQQMQQNGEDDSTIQAVVDDFKNKYSAPMVAVSGNGAPSLKQPQEAGFGTRFLEHFAPTAPFAHPSELAKDISALTSGASEDLARDPLAFEPTHIAARAGTQFAKDAYRAASDVSQAQFEKAIQADNEIQGFADIPRAQLKGQFYTGMGALGAIPLTTGISASELELENPATRAAGLGGLTGEAANFLLPHAPKALKGAGAALEEGAVNRYQSAFRPKLKFEGLARDVARESIDRGIWGSEKGLRKLSDSMLEDHGAELEQIYNNSQARVDLANVAKGDLDALAQRSSYGGVNFEPSIEKAASEMQMNLESAGDVPIADAWQLRRTLEQPAVKKGAYLPGVDPALVAKAEASQVAADALRPALGQAEPLSLEPSKNYSYAAKLKTALKNARSPNAPLSARDLAGLVRRQGGAALVGGALLGPKGAAAAALVAEIGRAIKNSTIFKTGSAVLQAKIGRLLQEGKIPEATQVWVRAGGSAAELPRLDNEAAY